LLRSETCHRGDIFDKLFHRRGQKLRHDGTSVAAMQQIADRLKELGVPEYTERFVKNHIDLSIFRELTDQDLKDLGVESLGHRRRMLIAIRELGGPGPPTPQATPAASPTPRTRQRRAPPAHGHVL
jgi:SAM domain (Sterile alpha motif)